ncbi:uncharacterized protein LOC124927179 [Impatiens glandulifera]|uniref:uncharacterized protein LOC124927179 n=1 Tax=Impatiens glandulifera TaxID=253017 RepID=UPI001FB142F1|nr:uncharacterized protein LOC124927179 [Impatiens glandulifera]
MDLWVVAAATGAGYLAKYWQSAINSEKDASSVHNHQQQFNESQGISRIWDHKDRPSNIIGLENSLERKSIWENNITENENFNLESTSYGVHRHDDIIDDLLLATKTFHPGIISVTSRNPVKPLSTMPPTVCPVLVTDGHRITNVGRNQEKEKPRPRERTSSVNDHHKGSAAASAAARASGVVLFFIGITIGVMTAAKTCKGEMDYLGKKLKNSDSLVQDLIDELDMKETIIVQELDEDHQHKQGLFMNEIETELEAELARLQIIDIRQPSANFYEDDEEEDDLDYDIGSANYAVSPKELKLRLYEVLESRLEARIRELEQALMISQAQEGN